MSESKNCDYGCGQKARYQYKNGVWSCSKFSAQCPELKKKNPGNYDSLKKYREKYGHPFTGKTSWCKGLTKETDERVRKIAEKNSKLMKLSRKHSSPSYQHGLLIMQE